MNRVQNESYTCKCTESTTINAWECHIKHEYKQKNGWIPPVTVDDKITTRIFNKNGTSVVTIEPIRQKDGRTYDQLIIIDWITGNVKKLTEGKFVVTQILANDEMLGKFYFIGTKENRPGERHLYSVDTGGRNNIICLTCELKVSFFMQQYPTNKILKFHITQLVKYSTAHNPHYLISTELNSHNTQLPQYLTATILHFCNTQLPQYSKTKMLKIE